MTSYMKASTFYIEGLLKAFDAIKRKSLFNTTAVVEAAVLDIAVKNMIEWAATIGSQDREMARKILKSFNSSMSEDELLKKMSSKWSQTCPNNNNPIMAVSPPLFTNSATAVEVSLLNSFNTQLHFANFCTEGLIWGMTYPEAVIKYIEENQSRREGMLSSYQKVNPEITHIPSFSDVVSESRQIAEKYISTLPNF